MNEMPQKSKLAPEVVVERDIAYPPEQAFAAWTSQDALRLWMGPGKVSAPDATMDARVGGAYVFPMRRPDGGVTTVRGVVTEIVANRKLCFTWSWDDEQGKPGDVSEVTLEFHPTATGTHLVLRHAGLTDPNIRERHQHGWSGCADSLEMYLAGKLFPCG